MDKIQERLARQKYEDLEITLQRLAPEAAIEQLSAFIQEFPDYPQAHNDIGVLLYKRGELLQALGRYERAVRLDPLNRTFRKNLASFYFVELGWTDDAIFMYTGLLKEDQNDTEVLGALALISGRINRPEEAGHFLRKILDLEPWNNEARDMLNAITSPAAPTSPVLPPAAAPVADQEEVNALLSELRQSISGLSLLDNQPAPETPKVEVASNPRIAELEDRLREDPVNALLNNDLGVLYLEQGDLERSLAHHELAFRYEPHNLIFRKNLAGICSVCEGKMDRAIELLTAGLKDHPADTELLAALAHISVSLRRKDEALIFLRRVLDLEPWNQEARSLIAQLEEAPSNSFFLNR